MPPSRLLAGILALLTLLGAFSPSLAIDVEHACDAAASRAERELSVPAGVLAAVGTVESGRSGPFGTAPWPWTINAAGRGTHFATKQQAIAAVLGLMQQGYPYIDIGCFQIDILYHAGVFRSLDEAFEPDRNAQEAARILAADRARGLDWATSVAHYHSANPAHGLPYLDRVRAALPRARTRAGLADMLRQIDDRHPAELAPDALPRVVYGLPLTDAAARPQIVRLDRNRTTVTRPCCILATVEKRRTRRLYSE